MKGYDMDDSHSKGSSRCKACNASFHANMNEHGVIEDLCTVCLPLAFYAGRDEDEGITAAASEQSEVTGDLLALDEYYALGEDSMGDLSLFDNY